MAWEGELCDDVDGPRVEILTNKMMCRFVCCRHPRSLNQQDRSNSAPNVCINSVKPLIDQRLLQSRGPTQADFVSGLDLDPYEVRKAIDKLV